MDKKKKWIKLGVLIGVIVFVIALDLVTKYVIDAQLFESGNTVSVIPGLFDFTIVHNYGAAWGILAGKQAFLIFLAVVFIAIFTWYYIKEKEKSWLLTIAFALIVSGCFGNVFDRIFFSYVRDFIQFSFWKTFPVFNFADVALCIGAVLFAIYLTIYFVRYVKEHKKDEKEEEYVEDNREQE